MIAIDHFDIVEKELRSNPGTELLEGILSYIGYIDMCCGEGDRVGFLSFPNCIS